MTKVKKICEKDKFYRIERNSKRVTDNECDDTEDELT